MRGVLKRTVVSILQESDCSLKTAHSYLHACFYCETFMQEFLSFTDSDIQKIQTRFEL